MNKTTLIFEVTHEEPILDVSTVDLAAMFPQALSVTFTAKKKSEKPHRHAVDGREKFKPGDRVLAGLDWGRVIGHSEWHADYVYVHADSGFMRAYHWAECYHERDVTCQ